MATSLSLKNRFEQGADLGSGGAGTVYHGWDLFESRRPVVLKLVATADTESVASLRRELRVMRRLQHPGLARVLHVGPWDTDHWVLVSDYVPGEPLNAWAAALALSDGHEAMVEAVTKTLGRLGATLAYVHAHDILHGDLKPPHVLMGDAGLPRLVDFGAAVEGADLQLGGTLAFLAPESLRNGERSAASDIYGLGATVLAALSGAPPDVERALGVSQKEWTQGLAATLREHQVHGVLADVLLSCLSLNPAARPTARELAEDLDPSWFRGSVPVAEPFVARDAALETLTTAWKHTTENRATAVKVVSGARGVGTTRLIEEVAALAELDGAIVLGGPRSSDDDPASQLLDQASRMGLLPESTSHMSDQARCLSLLEGLAQAPAEVPILLWLDALVPEEDILSQRLLERARDEAEARAALLGGGGPAWFLCASLGGTGEADVHLTPFSEAESQAYLKAALPEPPDSSTAQALYRLTGGNVDVLRRAAKAHWEQGIPVDQLADSLEASTDVVRDLETSAQRDILESVCCFEDPVPETLALSACLTLETLRPQDLDFLCSRALLRVDEAEAGERLLSTSHSVRAAVHILPSFVENHRRRHAAAADWLQTHANSSGLRATLGWQQLLAGNVDEGAERILEELPKSAAPRRTLTRLRRYELSPAMHTRVLREHARYALRIGEPELASHIFQQLINQGGADADDSVGLASALTELGQYQEAHDALPLNENTPTQLLRARLMIYLADYDRVARVVKGMKGLSSVDQARKDEALALSDLYRGNHREAEQRLRSAVDALDAATAPRVHAALQSALGMALQKQGKLRDAQRVYEQTLRAIRALGDRSREPARLINLGTLYQDEGQLDLALERYREAYAAAARLGHRREVVRVGYNQANLLLAMGAYDEAHRLVERALDHASALEMRVEALFLRLLLVECALAQGNLDEAEEILGSLESESIRSEHAIFERDIAVQRANLAWGHGGHQEALDHLAEHRNGDAEVLLLISEIHLDSPTPNVEEADNTLSLAQAEIDPKDDRKMFVLYTLGALLAKEHGDLERQRTLSQRAWEAMDRAALRIPARYREVWRNSPLISRRVQLLPEGPIGSPISTAKAAPPASTARDIYRRILQVNQRLARQTELTPLLELILDEAIDLAEAERGFILLRVGGSIRVVAARHLDMESLRKPESKFSHSLAEKVIQTGEPVVTLDALADDRFREQLSVHSLKLRSVVCAPLEVDNIVEGALYLDNRFRESAFDDTVVGVLTAFADQAGLALKHARMRESLLERQRSLEASQLELEELNDQLQQRVEVTASQLAQATQLLSHERDEQQVRYKFSNIVSRSGPMTKALSLVDRLAGVDVSVVIHGESGTGKELIARALHNASPRAEGPFVAINCAAIPETLLESELFGARKGAFTGADVDRPGLFKLAQGGTLFLDEVGDMPSSMQVKLLRVLENKTFRRLGDDRETATDVRVVAASNKDLQRLSDAGKFREDLFYRLNGATVRLPPLRDRAEDIQDLVPFLLERAAQDLRVPEVPPVSPLAMQALLRHDWPGNIRELDNALRQALALADGTIDVSHLPPSMAGGTSVLPALTRRGRGSVFRRAVGDYEKQLIEAALEQTDTATSAAKMLGLSQSVFYAKAKRHGVSLPRDRD